jgi:hypothetical protein
MRPVSDKKERNTTICWIRHSGFLLCRVYQVSAAALSDVVITMLMWYRFFIRISQLMTVSHPEDLFVDGNDTHV